MVNSHQQCPMWLSGGFARCWARWGHFRAGNCAFGSALISYIHLGCFGATAGGGIGRKKNVTGLRSPSLPIRQPARLGKRCQWACSGSVLLLGSLGSGFLSKKNVYNSYNIFTCIPIIIFYRENREWVDGTLDDVPNWETHPLLTILNFCLLYPGDLTGIIMI